MLKDTWRPRVDGVDDVDSSAVNEIAGAVIEAEKTIEKIKEQGGGGGSVEYAESAGYAEYASTAGEADFAYIADGDIEGRTLKGTILIDEGDVESADLYLEDGFEFFYGIISNSLMVFHDAVENMNLGFLSGLYFTTPSVIPENYSQCDSIYFKGDSTDEGAFVPEVNTRYTIIFFFDGNQLVGCVLGVPAPSVKEVE